jgi:hypothetical protein
MPVLQGGRSHKGTTRKMIGIHLGTSPGT